MSIAVRKPAGYEYVELQAQLFGLPGLDLNCAGPASSPGTRHRIRFFDSAVAGGSCCRRRRSSVVQLWHVDELVDTAVVVNNV